jgi:putative transposase
MPRKRFTNEQIAFALRQAENGARVDEVSRVSAVAGSVSIGAKPNVALRATT